jgi:hypothetical protein
MRQKLRRVFQLVGSDRSQRAAQSWPNSADRSGALQNLARKARPVGAAQFVASPGTAERDVSVLGFGMWGTARPAFHRSTTALSTLGIGSTRGVSVTSAESWNTTA